MKSLSTFVLALTFASTAFAAADLSVSTVAPSGVKYYENATYRVAVKNVGNKTSNGGQLQIDLQGTATSPQVYILGQVTSLPNANCTLSARRITCPIPRTSKNVTNNYDFGYTAPYSSGPISFTARIVPSTTDATGNNVTTRTLALSGHPFAIPDGYAVENRHCTGTALSSFFECSLFPSSISAHPTTFNAGGALDFEPQVAQAGYTGAWQQPSADRLTFQYYDNGELTADFDGRGIGGGCFEGVTRFWNGAVLSTYSSPYEICPL